MNQIIAVKDLELLREHLKSFGFIFPTSQIYGGLANSWDLAPLAVNISEELKLIWKEIFIRSQSAYLVDTKIILNPKVWQASGHLERFHDITIEELNSKRRFRLDHIFEKLLPKQRLPKDPSKAAKLLQTKVKELEGKPAIWGQPREFSLFFESSIGTLVERREKVYLRPETAQGVFINYKNLARSLRLAPPFSIGQIGRVFRNEITPGQLLFRGREFEQLEYESFTPPQQANTFFQLHLKLAQLFLKKAGLPEHLLRERTHSKDELAHYSKQTLDIEFDFPFGWGELLGIANRGNFDLKAHQTSSKEDHSYLDPLTKKRYIPHIVETSIGVERLLLAIFSSSFKTRLINNQSTPLLSFPPRIAPYHLAILPLLKRHQGFANKLYGQLLQISWLRITSDTSGSIGKRYRRQDAIGTPFIATIDELSLSTDTVTIRLRDSMEQLSERVPIYSLVSLIADLIKKSEQ